MFTWRFDDEPGRLERSIGTAVDDPVLAELVPAGEEVARRQATREVSSAVVVGHHTDHRIDDGVDRGVDGDLHHLEVVRRWVSDTGAGTEVRHVAITIIDGHIVDVDLDADPGIATDVDRVGARP